MSSTVDTKTLLTPRNGLLFAAWSLALVGALQAYQWEGIAGCTVCGPWGCGPPLEALIGYHGFWTLLIVPAVAILKARLGADALRRVGIASVLASISGLAALLLLEGLNNSAAEQYPLRWCLFRVVTFVDVPLVQLGLAGLWLRWSSRSPVDSHPTELEKPVDAGRPTTQAADL